MVRILTAAIGGVLLLAQAAFPAFAQTGPARPIKFVIPFSAGGSTDITARVMAEGLRPLLGQTVLIENRAGAGGNIAGDAVAKSAPDGYTYLVSSASLVVNQHLAAALFNNMVAGNMVHVAYKGGAPATTALLGGEIQTIFAPLIEVLPHIRAGSIKVLGV